MKLTNSTFLLVALILILIPIQHIFGQISESKQSFTVFERPSDCIDASAVNSENQDVTFLHEETYLYFRNIDCLEENQILKKIGFKTTFINTKSDKNTHFVLTGTAPRMDLKATYDREGILVKSLLVLEDIRIPSALRRHIYSGEYQEWTLTKTRKIVRDFDPSQTVYHVTLQNRSIERVLHFKEFGNTITFLKN